MVRGWSWSDSDGMKVELEVDDRAMVPSEQGR
jgi:hypothetical protein